MTTTLQEVVASEPKAYVFGGSVDQPELGANSRRLWVWVMENVSKKGIAQLKREVLNAQSSLAQPDRFIKWHRIVDAAAKLSITGRDGTQINAALVRRLQAEDEGGKIGRDRSITFAA